MNAIIQSLLKRKSVRAYTGQAIPEEDIQAKYEDGVLKIDLPRKEARKVPEKKQILIG